jgi:lipopolysaccharide export system permease protein
MGIINRYILRELGISFFCGFVVFTCLLLAVGLIQEAVDKHIPLLHVVQLIPFVLAKMSPISLPVTLLLAVTTFFARMSSNNEVIALKSLGISPRYFLLPVFVISAVISVASVMINEIAVTWGRQGINAVIYKGAEDILIEQLKQTHHFETSDRKISILVKGVDEQRRLISPTITLTKEAATLTAQSAQISLDFNANILSVHLVDVRVTGEGLKFAAHERQVQIPLGAIISSGTSTSASGMSLFQINEEKIKNAESIERQQRIIAANRVFGAWTGSAESWMTPEINDAENTIASLKNMRNRLVLEQPRRLATGFSCFFFVFLGAPLSIWMKRSDFFSSFFVCFTPILLLYYPLLMFGLSQGKSGALPPGCVWLANLTIGIVGLWFLRQIRRY